MIFFALRFHEASAHTLLRIETSPFAVLPLLAHLLTKLKNDPIADTFILDHVLYHSCEGGHV
jgi:hypothetical protein